MHWRFVVWKIGLTVEQPGAGCAVADPAREHEGERMALGVGQRVDFRRALAARAAGEDASPRVIVQNALRARVGSMIIRKA